MLQHWLFFNTLIWFTWITTFPSCQYVHQGHGLSVITSLDTKLRLHWSLTFVLALGQLVTFYYWETLSTNINIFNYHYLNWNGHTRNIVTLDPELYSTESIILLDTFEKLYKILRKVWHMYGQYACNHAYT